MMARRLVASGRQDIDSRHHAAVAKMTGMQHD
jgi:hypothetical protein